MGRASWREGTISESALEAIASFMPWTIPGESSAWDASRIAETSIAGEALAPDPPP